MYISIGVCVVCGYICKCIYVFVYICVWCFVCGIVYVYKYMCVCSA